MNYFITGATSGLGLQLVKQLGANAKAHFILPVRSNNKAKILRKQLEQLRGVTIETPIMDLASLDSVTECIEETCANNKVPIDGLIFNAGRQSAHSLEPTIDGFESTFAVNHLAHHLLYRGLRPLLKKDGIIGWTSSGTHDPGHRTAKMGGFQGAKYSDVPTLAQGTYTSVQDQLCRDAYATSKFCNLMSAKYLAKQDSQTQYFSFDPGLMPGTGLAREQKPIILFVWKIILPILGKLLPGTSSPKHSAAMMVNIINGQRKWGYNGEYIEFTGKTLKPWQPDNVDAIGEELLSGSDRLLTPWINKLRRL